MAKDSINATPDLLPHPAVASDASDRMHADHPALTIKTETRQQALTRRSQRFWPAAIPFGAMWIVLPFAVAAIYLALTHDAPLQQPADPLNKASFSPRPEWYFMFLFQLLKYFPGRLEVLGTVGIAVVFGALLIFLPFYDHNPSRDWRKRPVAVGSVTIVMVGLLFLTWQAQGQDVTSALGPMPGFSNPSSGGETASYVAVQAILTSHCASCHGGGAAYSNVVDLSSYAALMKGGHLTGGGVIAGAMVKPGDSRDSYLWQVVVGKQTVGSQMPLGSSALSSADVATIAQWIDKGAKGPNGEAPPVVAAVNTPNPTAPAMSTAIPGTVAAVGPTSSQASTAVAGPTGTSNTTGVAPSPAATGSRVSTPSSQASVVGSLTKGSIIYTAIQTTTLLDKPGGTALAELSVSTPLLVEAVKGSDVQVVLSAWSRMGPGKILYVDVGTVGSAIRAGIVVGTAPPPVSTGTDANTGVTWNKVQLKGWIATSATVTTQASLWSTANSLYGRSCGVCHALHKPTEFTMQQWPGNIKPMIPRTPLTPAQADLVLKYLQWHASDIPAAHQK